MSQLDALYQRWGQKDTLEALSRRFNPTAILLKLESGKIAVFDAARELFDIVDRWDLTAQLLDKVPAPRVAPIERITPQVRQQAVALDLEF